MRIIRTLYSSRTGAGRFLQSDEGTPVFTRDVLSRKHPRCETTHRFHGILKDYFLGTYDASAFITRTFLVSSYDLGAVL